ncbi:MAG TPA: hypothetical protein VFL88_00310 [Gemmatimonadales bacterium]|nr:hypothetical protein [Gemmatimonadales bacterium]
MRPCVLLLILVTACASRDSRLATAVVDTVPNGVITVHNTGPTAWTDSSHAWHFAEVARIEGTADTTSPLINPGTSALDALGRVVVVERSPASIKVLDRDGRLVRRFSREGSGPGELRNPSLVAFDSLIVVDDPQLARLEVFDTTGHLLHEYPAPCCYFYGLWADDSGRAYARTAPADSTRSGAFIRIDARTGMADTVEFDKLGEEKMWTIKAGDGSIRYGIPYAPHEVIGFTPTGHALHGWSSMYRYTELSPQGDTVRVVSRDWTPVERPESMRRARYDTMVNRAAHQFGQAAVRAAFNFSDIPAKAEAMRSIESDPAGRIWVSVFTGDTVHREFEVFDRDGVLLGRVRAPWPADEFVQWRGAREVLTQGETEDGFPLLRIWALRDGQDGRDRQVER